LSGEARARCWRRTGLLAGLLLASGAAGQPASDSLRPRDSLTAAESAAIAPVRAGRPLKSAGSAVLLSLLLPGGGQVYTGEWWKTLLIAPAEVGLGYYTYRTHLDASAALGQGDSARYVSLRDRRTALLWWTGAVIVFSMTDAYVSAQMYGFDREMRFAGQRLRIGVGLTGVGVRLGF
jgi:hypothetical protein